MPELSPNMTQRQPRRPSTARTLVVLLLVFVFCASALVAGGALDDGIDASEASTRILTPEEVQQMAEDSNSASRGGEESAPVALIAALLLVSGMLLVTLAVPTRAERRRAAGPGPAPGRPNTVKTVPAEPRRQMGAGIQEFQPADGDSTPTTVLQPIRTAPRITPTPLPPIRVPDATVEEPVERRFRAGAVMR